jgi:hypothetical protein
MPRTANWRKWLEDHDIRRWHDNLAMNSPSTADERLKLLSRYCRLHDTTPAKLAGRAKDSGGPRAVHEQLQDFVVRIHKPHKPSDHGEDDAEEASRDRCRRGHTPGYLAQYVKAVRSWMDHNDVTLRRVRTGDANSAPTVENEVPITPEQLQQVLAAASPRGRVVVSLVGLAGLRPESLGMRRAEDGLVLEDLPDLEIEGRRVRLRAVPAQVMVRRGLSKVRRRYFSFLPSEACKYLTDYLGHRLARGEQLTPKSPLIRPDYNYERRGRPDDLRGRGFLTTQAISAEIRDALRACALIQRPYALRGYFIQRLESAERDGKIPQIDRLFFSGRNEAIDLRYSHFKNLPQTTVEEMRRVYKACEPYFGTRRDSVEEGLQVEELSEALAEMFLKGAPADWKRFVKAIQIMDEGQMAIREELKPERLARLRDEWRQSPEYLAELKKLKAK